MFAALPLLLIALSTADDGTSYEKPFRAGLILLQQNQLAEAQATLSTAARLAPRNGRVWMGLAQTYWKLHEASNAKSAAEKAFQFASTDPVVLRGLAIYYSESKQAVKAAEMQARYAAANPRDPDALAAAASLYLEAVQPLLKSEKFSEAIEILRRAKSVMGENPQIDLALGVACYGLRRFDEAAAQFLSVIRAAPEIEQPYLFLGKMLDQIPDRLPEVMSRFVSFEKANPADYRGYLLHAKALEAQAIEPEAARALLERSIAMNVADASAHFELATLLERRKLLKEAAREFERAAALDPSDAATHYRLSRVYERLGDSEGAAAERERHAALTRAQDSAR
ncbi:MAG: tetratricopeptide repeat protein [Bryobacteraceae bacterium]